MTANATEPVLTCKVITSYPLSPMQQGMLFHWLREPHAGIDLLQIACTLSGIDIATFQRAWDATVAHHSILRTSFRWRDADAPVQEIWDRVSLAHHFEDLRTLSGEEQQRRLEAFVKAERLRGFNLADPPLLRFAYFRLAEDRHEFLWSFPHILMDARSLVVVLNDVLSAYRALEEGRDPELADTRPFAEFIEWLGRQEMTSAQAFWRKDLAGYSSPVFPDTGFASESALTAVNAELELRMTVEETDGLRAFVRAHGLTMNTMVQGAWALLLGRYARTDDVVFGATRAGRGWARGQGSAVDRMVGLFMNTPPVRVRLPAEQRVVEWLQEIRASQVAVRAFEHTSLTDIQAVSAVSNRVPLFETIIIFEHQRENTTLGAIDPRCTNFRMIEKTPFPITLHAYSEQAMLLRFEYDAGRFDAATIGRMLRQLAMLLREMVAKFDGPLRMLSLLSPAEREQQLVEWNRTAREYPKDRCTVDLIAKTAASMPDRVAVVDSAGEVRFGDLEAAANRLARYLDMQGIGPGSLVAIFLDRTRDLVVSLLASMKVRAAYLPLDPEYPASRIESILEDAVPGAVITESALCDRLPKTAVKKILVDESRQAIAALPASPLGVRSDLADLAYVIYTSGSTGRPKGVQVIQRGLLNFLCSMRVRPGLTADDTLLAVTTISFDIAALELYLPLMVGARVVLVPRHAAVDGPALAQLASRSKATVLQATPATWRMLLEAGWKNPERITMLCGGEAVPAALATELHATGGALWNMYGPTETTIWSSVDCVDGVGAEGMLPVGGPIDNTTFYVLDTHQQPVPVGVSGELYIGGDGVARGYLNRAELTAEKFVANPFGFERDPILYKTGDLVRVRADAKFDFLGRLDHQVKLRGYRIELGEIEASLLEHPAICDAVVMAREDQPGMKQLVAYVRCVPGPVPAASEMREFLSGRLPSYMVPAACVVLESFPVTPNNKVDRKALPAPEAVAVDHSMVAPRDEIEARVLKIWQDVLGHRSLGITDHFNDVGGHSLAAVQVFSRIHREFGRELQLVSILKHDTVKQLSALLRRPSDAEEWRCIVPLNSRGKGQTVFCLPPHSGRLLLYQHLARELEGRHAFLGVQGYGNWGEQQPMETVEEASDYYTGQILAAQRRWARMSRGTSCR